VNNALESASFFPSSSGIRGPHTCGCRGFDLTVRTGRVLHTPLQRVRHARGVNLLIHKFECRRRDLARRERHLFCFPGTHSFSAECQNLKGHSPARLVHCGNLVHSFFALLAVSAHCYRERKHLTWLFGRGPHRAAKGTPRTAPEGQLTTATSLATHTHAQKSRPHAPSVPMRSAPAYFLCKWEV
jgi:hypothetical protein